MIKKIATKDLFLNMSNLGNLFSHKLDQPDTNKYMEAWLFVHSNPVCNFCVQG